MKIFSITATLILFFALVANSQEPNKPKPLTIADLNKRPVIGSLGIPLGTPVEIQAQVISGKSTRLKTYDGLYLLKVTHVSGKKLGDGPLMEFGVFGSAELASDHFDLYLLKNGGGGFFGETIERKDVKLNTEVIEKLEKGYVGKTVRLVVYELGSFYGNTKDRPLGGGVAFGFRTSLVVLDELK